VDFDAAIKAHSVWKMKLSGYLRHPDKSLKALDVEPDNRCDLGKWIHGEGMALASRPEYATLKDQHARFHKAAAAVIRKADAGQDVGEETALGGKSDFAASSTSVVSAIMAMKRLAG